MTNTSSSGGSTSWKRSRLSRFTATLFTNHSTSSAFCASSETSSREAGQTEQSNRAIYKVEFSDRGCFIACADRFARARQTLQMESRLHAEVKMALRADGQAHAAAR